MPDALEAVEASLKEQAAGTGINQPRQRVRQPGGILNLMGGALVERGYWGYKAYTVTRQGVRFTIALYDIASGQQLALIEANYLGQLRTGAASGVATQYLARPQARTLALFGSGGQAETQLAAIAGVRPLDDVRVYSRKAERREAFAAQMSQQHGLPVRAVASSREALDGADMVATATTAREPVFDGNDLAPGVHINAAGSNALSRTEVDHTTIRRASCIVADDLEQARQESGDLAAAYQRNALAWERVRPLCDVVAGLTSGRTSDDDITLFESQGLALWDIALAATAYERAAQAGSGTEVEFSL
jgi:ornithine cyclodeaminase/alanine dehydrogenase-like protein (mu-crystallin family)